MIKEVYKIEISNNAIELVMPSKYSSAASNNSNFKIYIVKQGNNFLYVGMAKQSIRTRFYGSFRAFSKKKKNGVTEYGGYSGYKWLEKYQNTGKHLDLIVFPIINKTIQDDIINAEAIEAEIVFLIRNNPPYKWPLSQHEIHFHNLKGAKETALKIYNEIK